MEMNDKEMQELVNRYVYDVVRRLPQNQREDIDREIRGLIEDMLQDKAGENLPTIKDLEEVLQQLGKPADLSDKYRDEKRCLIGPAYFDTYVLVLKIVLICTGFGVALACILSYFTATPDISAKAAYQLVPSVLSGLMEGFAWVTIIFFIIERYAKTPVNQKFASSWKPSDLPLIPSEKSIIKKSSPIVGIFFTTLVIIIFNAAPQLIGATSIKNGAFLYTIPIFNLQVLASVMWLLNISFALGIIKELARLIIGRYSLKLFFAVAVINVISLVILCIVFGNTIWNSDFVAQVAASSLGVSKDIHFITGFLNEVPKIFIAIVIFGYVLDTLVNFIKAIRADGKTFAI